MKKYLLVFLLFISIFSIVSCASVESSPSIAEKDSVPSSAENKENINYKTPESNLELSIPKTNKKSDPVVIGLALGGGAAKGFAHIGVIKALEANGIRAQIITGTSAGSLVGSLYAYGYTPAQLEQIGIQLDPMNLADISFSTTGLIKGERLQSFVNSKVHNVPLEKLPKKFTAVATDMDSGQSIGFNNGNTGVAVRASCSIPSIFMPVKIGNHRYVDGGLSAPVPVTYARQAGANFVIAVDITARPQQGRSGLLSNVDQTINIMGMKLLEQQLKQADIVIAPDTSLLSSFDFKKKDAAVMAGYNATMKQMPLIKQKLKELQNQ
ncbi:MAG: patatin-like phospholipase family protein [Burkholderiales bacterium]|nr:patatin-like phospholipase family protein [Burkholderiales bacterium]